jgi:hypothetical protein
VTCCLAIIPAIAAAQPESPDTTTNDTDVLGATAGLQAGLSGRFDLGGRR